MIVSTPSWAPHPLRLHPLSLHRTATLVLLSRKSDPLKLSCHFRMKTKTFSKTPRRRQHSALTWRPDQSHSMFPPGSLGPSPRGHLPFLTFPHPPSCCGCFFPPWRCFLCWECFLPLSPWLSLDLCHLLPTPVSFLKYTHKAGCLFVFHSALFHSVVRNSLVVVFD